MKYLGNGVVFAVLYILFMLPTYFLPYFGSNSAILGAASAITEMGIPPQTIFHVIALAVLIILTRFRGSLVDKQWLTVLPVIAAIFDMVPTLNIIPLVPTVMHIFVLIKGVSSEGTKIAGDPEVS